MQLICRYDPIVDDNDNNDNGDDDNDDWRSMMMGWYNDSQLRVGGCQVGALIVVSAPPRQIYTAKAPHQYSLISTESFDMHCTFVHNMHCYSFDQS